MSWFQQNKLRRTSISFGIFFFFLERYFYEQIDKKTKTNKNSFRTDEVWLDKFKKSYDIQFL